MLKNDNRSLIVEPPFFAHRGASLYAPENTMAAFLKAKLLGLCWIEFDVTLSADNEVVVIHDETVDRTTDGSGYVCDYSYKDLMMLDAGSWFSHDFVGQRIPLLRDVIGFLRNNNMGANIEIKPMPGNEDFTAKRVIEEIRQHWTLEMRPPLISSFSLTTLYALRKQQFEGCLGLLMDEWDPKWQTISTELNCVSIHPNQKIVNPQKIAAFKSAGYSVFCYTVNELPRAQELFLWGVDAVYSDCPDKLK